MQQLSGQARFNLALACKSAFMAASDDDFAVVLKNTMKFKCSGGDIELNGVVSAPDPRYTRKQGEDNDW